MVTSTLGFPQDGPEMESNASDSLGRRGQETPVGKGGRDGNRVTPSTVRLWQHELRVTGELCETV